MAPAETATAPAPRLDERLVRINVLTRVFVRPDIGAFLGALLVFLNGVTVVKTKLPSFIVTLATFFILQGVNAAGTLKLTGLTAIEDIDSASGFTSARRFLSSTWWSPYDFKVKVLWWMGITIV